MNHQLSLAGALLRKDTRLFWQFAVLNGALIAFLQFPDLVARLGPLAGIAQASIPLATILLILLVFFEDAIVSVKHDWLTRPIPGTALLLGKSAFVFLAIVVPSILGGIANNLFEGRSLGEALLAGVSSGANGGLLTLIVVVMAFAALTASIRQAIVVFLISVVVVILLSVLIIATRRGGGDIGPSGSLWVLRSLELVLTVVAVVVVWLQYRHRHTRVPRVIVGVALVAGVVFLASMTWPRIFGVQKLFSADPAAASTVSVELAGGCFPARVLDADRNAVLAGPAAAITPELYSEELRKRAAPDAIAFATQLIQQSVPAGHRLTLGPAEMIYRTPSGGEHTLYADRLQWKATEQGLPAANHYWLLSRADYERLAALGDVETHIDYSLSLLAPAATAEFAADGRRAFYPGIGYCGATLDRFTGLVHVDCFKAGVRPAQLVANLDGAPDIESKASGRPDFTPAALDFWGGRRYRMQLRTQGGNAPRVKLTAFEARAHFNRQIVVPGVLGGSVSACPAPRL